MSYGLLSRSLETSLLNSNIVLMEPMTKKCYPPKLAFTSNRASWKAKTRFPPVPCGPCILQWNRFFTNCIVGTHRISMLVVVVHSLQIIEGCPLSTNSPENFSSHLLICPTGGHQHHEIILLFHSNDTKRNIFMLPMIYTHAPKTLFCEVNLVLNH